MFVQPAFLFLLQCLCRVVLPGFRAAMAALLPLCGGQQACGSAAAGATARRGHRGGSAQPSGGCGALAHPCCSVSPVLMPSVSNPSAGQERAPVRRLGDCSVLRAGIHEMEEDHLQILPSVDVSSSLRALHTTRVLVVQTVIENLFHPHF